MRSKRVARQLKKTFGEDAIGERLPRLLRYLDTLPDCEDRQGIRQFLENFPAFLDLIEESYGQFEERAHFAQRSLEISSEELTTANRDLFELNRTFDALVNSLGQGFLLFGRDGICLPTCSKACEQLLEATPAGKPIASVLKVPESKRRTFDEWCRICFEEMLDFEDAAQLGQATYPHSRGLTITLDYKAVRDNEGKIAYIVLIATDRTEEFKARKMAEEMHNYATLVVSILKDKERFRSFIQEAKRLILTLRECLSNPRFDAETLQAMKRHLHTLKGASASFGLAALKKHIHEVETKLSDAPGLDPARAILSREVPRIEGIFESVLMENRALLGQELLDGTPKREFTLDFLAGFASRIRVDRGDRRKLFEDFVDQFLGIPAEKVFSRHNMNLQQVAGKLGKEIAPIRFSGGDLRIFPERYDSVFCSLIHVFRNIADHGIETPEIRRQRGKEPAGLVRVDFERIQGPSAAGPVLRIRISDDGNGIDVERIRTRLRQEGREEQARNATPEQLVEWIFESGFSTNSAVSDISGRGVGLDAVREAITKLGGTIRAQSVPGKGTTFTIDLPILGFDPPSGWNGDAEKAA